ncbi:MAG TPA: PKD domain-containing protein, partial [Flavobacteriales bacterium]|nr:PKD domain-containing protein [Flavobacteriales bacterium]
IVTVTINLAADAGSDASVTLCETAAAFDLATLLGGSPQTGGAWTGPGGTGVGATFTPGTSAAGDYTYTVTGAAPCVNASATVHIDVVASPYAGLNGALALCTNGPEVDLFGQLGGSPDAGGTWTAPNGATVPAALDPGAAQNGDYTYTLLATAPCPNATAHVTVVVNPPPADGLFGEVHLCETAAPVDLLIAFNSLAAPDGAWTDPSGYPVTIPIDPGTAVSGTYTYTIHGIEPCPIGVNTVLFTIDVAPDAGLDGSLTLCASGVPQTLFPALGGTPDATGAWTAPNGTAFSGTADPASAAPGTYTYVVPANGLCPSDASQVALSIVQPPDAGTDNTVQLCENDATSDLFTVLLGTPQSGGYWTDPAGLPFDGQLAPGSAVSGTYIYTVPGQAPCPNASASINVGIAQLPEPGHDAMLELCPEAGVQSMFAAISPASTGGVWTGPAGPLTSDAFDPATMAGGTFTYTVTGAGACSDTQLHSSVAVTVWSTPSALFALDTTRGCLPVTVSMHLGDGSIASAVWQFGDGDTGYGAPQASHTFTSPGWQSIQVAVTDTNGCHASYAIAQAVYVQPL